MQSIGNKISLNVGHSINGNTNFEQENADWLAKMRVRPSRWGSLGISAPVYSAIYSTGHWSVILCSNLSAKPGLKLFIFFGAVIRKHMVATVPLASNIIASNAYCNAMFCMHVGNICGYVHNYIPRNAWHQHRRIIGLAMLQASFCWWSWALGSSARTRHQALQPLRYQQSDATSQKCHWIMPSVHTEWRLHSTMSYYSTLGLDWAKSPIGPKHAHAIVE